MTLCLLHCPQSFLYTALCLSPLWLSVSLLCFCPWEAEWFQRESGLSRRFLVCTVVSWLFPKLKPLQFSHFLGGCCCFCFEKSPHTFCSGCTGLYSSRLRIRIRLCSHPRQPLMSFVSRMRESGWSEMDSRGSFDVHFPAAKAAEQPRFIVHLLFLRWEL